MKSTTGVNGFFRALIGLFLDNWGLKIVSLALAAIIYFALAPDVDDKSGAHPEPSIFRELAAPREPVPSSVVVTNFVTVTSTNVVTITNRVAATKTASGNTKKFPASQKPKNSK